MGLVARPQTDAPDRPFLALPQRAAERKAAGFVIGRLRKDKVRHRSRVAGLPDVVGWERASADQRGRDPGRA